MHAESKLPIHCPQNRAGCNVSLVNLFAKSFTFLYYYLFRCHKATEGEKEEDQEEGECCARERYVLTAPSMSHSHLPFAILVVSQLNLHY